jgi:hypothetical protein
MEIEKTDRLSEINRLLKISDAAKMTMPVRIDNCCRFKQIFNPFMVFELLTELKSALVTIEKWEDETAIEDVNGRPIRQTPESTGRKIRQLESKSDELDNALKRERELQREICKDKYQRDAVRSALEDAKCSNYKSPQHVAELRDWICFDEYEMSNSSEVKCPK